MSLFRTLRVVLLALVIAYPVADDAWAQDVSVDLELVLAVDVSWSMDLDEQRLQRDGYAAALRDPEVHKAIAAGPSGRIAVIYIEWAGIMIQRTVIPWTLIDSPAAARDLAARLDDLPISRDRLTSISGALAFSAKALDQSPFKGIRRVIDVSGDGPNNNGPPVLTARDEVLAKGIVINGLPIMLKTGSRGSYFDVGQLDAYYHDCVIGGQGSFVIPIKDRSEFGPAIRRKLLLEIAGRDTGPRIVPTQLAQPTEQPTDCLIGEKMWNRYMDGPGRFDGR
jgi:hypothetical protein